MDRQSLHPEVAIEEVQRASAKRALAKAQIEGLLQPPQFADADASEQSAGATVSTHLSMVKTLADWGKQSAAGRSMGGDTRAQQRKDEAAKAAIAIRAEAMRLLADHASHEICGILMQRKFGGRDKVMRALRGDASTAVHWLARKKKSRKLSV